MMDRTVASRSKQISKVGKSKLRLKSHLMLMPWEKRHQHTLENFLGNAQNSVQTNFQGNSTKTTYHPPQCFEADDLRSLNCQEPDETGINQRRFKHKDPPECENEKGTENRISKHGYKHKQCHNKAVGNDCMVTSIGVKLPESKSDGHCNSCVTDGVITNDNNHVTPISPFAAPDVQAWPKVEQVQDPVNVLPLSKVVSSMCESQISDISVQEEITKKKNVSNHDQQNSAGLNKTFKYAAKYNLDEMFTYSFPVGKKPLRQRLL